MIFKFCLITQTLEIRNQTYQAKYFSRAFAFVCRKMDFKLSDLIILLTQTQVSWGLSNFNLTCIDCRCSITIYFNFSFDTHPFCMLSELALRIYYHVVINLHIIITCNVIKVSSSVVFQEKPSGSFVGIVKCSQDMNNNCSLLWNWFIWFDLHRIYLLSEYWGTTLKSFNSGVFCTNLCCPWAYSGKISKSDWPFPDFVEVGFQSNQI